MAEKKSHDSLVDFELAIVGAGIAGISLALELEIDPSRVVLIESGSDHPHEETNRLKTVISEGIEIRSDSRERVLGGTSLTWSGALATLDQVDFAGIEGVHDGWPIDLDEVIQEFNHSSQRYGVPEAASFSPGMVEDSVFDSGVLAPKVVRIQNPPLRYWDLFGKELLRKGFNVWSGYTVTSVSQPDLGPISERVWDIKLHSRKKSQSIRVNRVVLAAGAIETVRLLLASQQEETKLAQLPAIGTHFMNHPKGEVGKVFFSQRFLDSHPFFHIGDGGLPGIVGIRLSDDTIRRFQLSNPYVRLAPQYSKSVFFARRVFQSLIGCVRHIRSLHWLPRKIGSTNDFMWGGVGEVAPPAQANQGKKKLALPVRSASLMVHTDMAPRSDNVIRLSEKKDDFGVPYPIVDHRLSEVDIAAVERLTELIRNEFRRLKIGRVALHPDIIAGRLDRDASHHLGGARMGLDPQGSVVDTNLKVHGLEGLYVLGGAVFPAGGNANPTLIILALAHRLAKHLSGRLS